MSETWTSLLAGVVGALVGGAASLAGTMLVNKQQMATNARMRLYDELLPNLARAIESISDDDLDPASAQVAREQMPDPLEAVRRASAIAGRDERRSANMLWTLWLAHLDAGDGLGEMRAEIQKFSDHLGAKLG
jgi:hypothetical protein